MKIYTAPGGYLFRMEKQRTVYLHIEVAERALGRALPPSAEVHHINGDPADNRPCNLVICPDHAYHSLLHQRLRAREACGNAGFRPCRICHVYDDPATMKPHRNVFYHSECLRRQSREQRARTRIAK